MTAAPPKALALPEMEVVEIAGRLTKAQRAAVVGAQHREKIGAWHPDGWHVTAYRTVRYKLVRLRLTVDYLRPWNRLTPLGLAVRAHLLENPHAPR